MDKYQQRPDETVVMKGSINYVQGDLTFTNFLKGRAKVTECTCFLTSQRFVATKKRKFFPWGPLIWIFIALTKRKIVFEIPLAAFAAIESDKEAKTHVVFKTADGTGFRMVWPGLFDKPETWTAAIAKTVVTACPGVSAQTADGAIRFAKNS